MSGHRGVYRGIKTSVSSRSALKRRWTLASRAKTPPRALEIWRERPDLRRTFDLSNRTGRKGLLEWYIRHAFQELGLKKDEGDREIARQLNARQPNVRKLSILPVTRLMHVLRVRAPKSWDLKTERGQTALVSWFYARGLMEANLSSFLQTEQAMKLLAPDAFAAGAPLLTRLIWLSAPELRGRFGGLSDTDFQEFCRSAEGARAFPILSHPLINLAAPPSRRPIRYLPFGVNLIGHAFARSGISEDLRMASRVLDQASIPFVVRNVAPGELMPEEELAGTNRSDGTMPYAINMLCMPASSTVTAARDIGPAVLANHYNIGFWPWELPEMPAFWHHAYDLVDEIWASTRFTHAAFSRSSPAPVLWIPFAVQTDQSDGLRRTDFGLPEGSFLFGCAVDGLSSFARKGPLAAVQAFKQAFSSDDRSVGLVVKGIRVEDDPTWAELLDVVGDDPRVHFVTKSLPRGSLLDLWRALDCFVSLHRSEGFGRNIAETMLLGKPVIVTAHSGNMDFTDSESAALVTCSLREVAEGEYPFGAGQLWAEPNISVAAQQMQRMAADRAWRDRLASAGQVRIATTYDSALLGEQWRSRLEAIYAG